MTNHKQVKVYYFGYDEEIEVDEDIADLLQLIWKQGYRTIMSCQNNFNYIWIHFSYLKEFKSLYRTAYNFHLNKGKKYNNITLYSFLEKTFCNIKLQIDDDGYLINEDKFNEEYISGSNIEFSVSVRFDIGLKDLFIQLWKQTFEISEREDYMITEELTGKNLLYYQTDILKTLSEATKIYREDLLLMCNKLVKNNRKEIESIILNRINDNKDFCF